MDTSERQRVPPLAADREPWLGPSFELVEPKLHPPSGRPGIVPRTALVEQLLASQTTPIVCVVAPAGYGKTTVLAQWAERKRGRVAWVSVDQRDNDPVVLLSYIAVALDRVEPIDPDVLQALASPGAAILATVVPRLAAAVSQMTAPVAVVMDHVELLDNLECLDAVAELAVRLPEGSQLVLASRRTPPLPVALLRAQGQMVEVGVDELEVISDSELLVHQMRGEWKIKNEALRVLWQQAQELADRTAKVRYTAVRREHNELADRLVEALDAD